MLIVDVLSLGTSVHGIKMCFNEKKLLIQHCTAQSNFQDGEHFQSNHAITLKYLVYQKINTFSIVAAVLNFRSSSILDDSLEDEIDIDMPATKVLKTFTN